MRKLKLSNGEYTLVDTEDYFWLSSWKWHKGSKCVQRNCTSEEKRNKGFPHVRKIHQEISDRHFGGKLLDHKDRDTLNNRKRNLRPATFTQNMRNRGLFRRNTSGCKGVSWDKRYKKWWVRIGIGCEKRKSLGYFSSLKKASRAYDIAAKKFHKEFALTNLQLH